MIRIMTYERSTLVNSEKYIGLDVHQATISVAVMDGRGKVVMESIVETKAATILEFLAGLRGTLSVTFEEGTWAAWLYDLLKPHVSLCRTGRLLHPSSHTLNLRLLVRQNGVIYGACRY
jgi:hypothetical protein